MPSGKPAVTVAEALQAWADRHDGARPRDVLDDPPDTTELSIAEVRAWATTGDTDAEIDRWAHALDLETDTDAPRTTILWDAARKISRHYRLAPERRGRPTALTPDVHATIVLALHAGNFVETAASLAGVSVASVYDWKNRGDLARRQLDREGQIPDTEVRFLDFAEAVDHARASAEDEIVSALRSTALGGTVKRESRDPETGETTSIEYALPNVAAQTFFLERSAPTRWGRRNVEVTGPDGGPIDLDVKVSARETVLAALGEIAERAGGLDAGDSPGVESGDPDHHPEE